MRANAGDSARKALVIAVSVWFRLTAETANLHAQEGDTKMRIVAAPQMIRANDFYVSNRPPLRPSPLIKLPIGRIRPAGWLRHQLELMADGMTGRLPELSKWCRFEGSAWASPDGDGENGWEELPYWLKGFGDLGYVLGDERITAEARKWIEAVLNSGQPDGWFGPRANRTALKGKPDMWPHMVMLNCLQSFHETFGDPRVLTLMTNYFRWQTAVPPEDFLVPFWQKVRAGDNLESVYWLYNRTGEARLLDLAKKIHAHAANWTGGISSWHGVNICQGFREPAVFYMQSNEPRHLEAAGRNYQTVMELYGQVPGGMFGADENCRPGYAGPRQAAETCSMVEFMWSNELLLRITGNPLFADRCEEIAFNSLPAAQPPDLKGLHYLTAPNMIQLDRRSKAPLLQNSGNMLAYDPHGYRCCQHNVSHGWPYYAEHLWLATPDKGLAAVFYAPCQVEAKVGDGTTVRLVEETDYPFGEEVRFRLSTPKPVEFPLLLRIPRWCEQARVEVNGRLSQIHPTPLSYLMIERLWKDGDTVRLHLPASVKVRTWEKNNNCVSVDRGPLTFSLRIAERWERYGGTDKWPAYEVYPASPWNYGLVLNEDAPAASFKVVKKEDPLAPQPFTPEAAPIRLAAKARRIPQWQAQMGLVGLLQDSPARSNEPAEEVALIPMGCARLRISAFPVIGEGPGAHTWKEPPPPPSASHCWPSDTVYALNDGLLPKSSNDHGIPRFTWWDHRGTEEWVQYTFEGFRRISWCEVYWFDDTGKGMCRVPASWRVLWKDGETWRPVAQATGYGVKPDQFNRVDFTAVETQELRLEVQLQKGFSGGILEWRAGG